MTENSPNDTTQTAPTTEPAPVPAPEPTAETGQPKAGAEAAKYRTQLRTAEAERDALAARVEILQKAQVEALAADLAKPAALWATGATLADLLDDEGNVDPDKVNAAVESARDELGLAVAPRTPRPDPTQGAKGGGIQSNAWVAAMSSR